MDLIVFNVLARNNSLVRGLSENKVPANVPENDAVADTTPSVERSLDGDQAPIDAATADKGVNETHVKYALACN